MMRRIAGRECSAFLLVATCIVGFAGNLWSQQNAADPCVQASTANAKLPAFEIATVKPFFTRVGFAGLFVYPGGRVGAGHLNLRLLLMFACNVQKFQVVGGPGWADSDYFNIEAKPPDSSPSAQSNPPNQNFPPSDDQRQMLLALLIDRFQLKFHVEKKEGPVYLLERGKGELKLNPPKNPANAPSAGLLGGEPMGVAGLNASMPYLAARLSEFLERPVIEQTGIAGSFDFEFKTGEQASEVQINSYADLVPTILESVRGIGLDLKSARGPVETIVIDHAEQPSPN